MIASALLKSLAIAGLLATSAYGAPEFDLDLDLETRDDLPDGYTEVPVEWEVQAFPGGDALQLNGTIEKIHAQLLELNPNYDTDFPVLVDDEDSIEARAPCNAGWHHTRCNTNRNKAKLQAINNGIKYLRSKAGRPSLPAGPGKCGRVSCSYNSGIWWCNDYNHRHTLGSYNSIAKGARCIANKCASTSSNTLKGQTFAKGSKWNVMPNSHC
ncbi:hypothetical protein CC79DRAFT_1399524 [Sarocladium strictum]